MTDDPLFEDLGYRPPIKGSQWLELELSAQKLAASMRKFVVSIKMPPDDLKKDPAPDWR